MKLQHALLAAGVLALPVAATAQPANGIYIGAGGGYDIHSDNTSLSGPTPSLGIQLPSASTNLFSKSGVVGLGSIGYAFGNGMRAEFETSYRQTAVTRNVTGPVYDGYERQYSFMLNGIYDIDMGLPVKPFVGAGAGATIISWNPVNRTLNGINCCAPYFGANSPVYTVPINVTNNADGKDVVASFQLMAGASYDIPGVPGLSLNAQFRFFDAPHNIDIKNFLTLKPTVVSAANPIRTGNGATTYSGHTDQSFIIGLTYAFGAPAAPAAAPAAPIAAAMAPSPVSRSYIVFFDWDKADLTTRAQQIVAEAAANSTKVQYTRLEVNGYTDTSGTVQYNQGLSIRRAQSVAAQLVKDGVPKSAISIQGFGETHPLVATGAGVREPQNRRVEIIIK